MEGLEDCPKCAKERENELMVETPNEPAKKLNNKMIMRIGAIIIAIIAVVGLGKLIDGGKSSIKESVVGQVLYLKDGDTYTIVKKDIKSIENIKDQTLN